jgi:hypothetical protein
METNKDHFWCRKFQIQEEFTIVVGTTRECKWKKEKIKSIFCVENNQGLWIDATILYFNEN